VARRRKKLPTFRKFLLGAFGDPGHAFPAIALGRALRARGHAVTIQTWRRWREHIEAEGIAFAAAPEYHVFPTRGRPLKPYEAVVHAARETLPLVRELAPDAVVADILTLAPALAAELEGVPVATLVPHVDPRTAPGFPPYSLGARLPRTAAGRALWQRVEAVTARGLERGRDELNASRAKLGLGPIDRVHNGISDRLVLVATFPQLEYPRAWPPSTHVIGPLLWELPYRDVPLPDGDAGWPLVLVAPSTSQDPSGRLLRAAVEGLAGEPVRVLATWNRRLPQRPLRRLGANTRLAEWVSYARTMPRCDAVVCHAGHGTMVRALASGCVVVAVPAAGDMNENAARLDWAGAGVRLPGRFVGPAAVRVAVAQALGDPARRARARTLAEWAQAADPGAHAAQLLEAMVAAKRG